MAEHTYLWIHTSGDVICDEEVLKNVLTEVNKVSKGSTWEHKHNSSRSVLKCPVKDLGAVQNVISKLKLEMYKFL